MDNLAFELSEQVVAAASSRGLTDPKSSCTPGPKDEIGASGGGGRPFLSVAHPEENVPFDSNKRKCKPTLQLPYKILIH